MTTTTAPRPRAVRLGVHGLETRGDGRTIAGIAAPFGTPTTIRDNLGTYTEIIERGAFARTIKERGPARVKLLAQHDAAAFPIGRATMLREDAGGLYAEFRVAETPRGDEALQLVKEGALDGLSIGFAVLRDAWTNDPTTRHLLEAKLLEVSLVSWPAYDQARVTAVREAVTPTLAAAMRQLELRKRTP